LLGAALLFAQLILVTVLPYAAKAATVTPRIELEGAPGQALVENIKIQNEERQSKTYYLSVENFVAQDESGTPSFSPRKEDLSAWISGPESVTVGPGESREVAIKIAIPANAEPGGHFAAVFFQTTPPTGDDNAGQVGISAKLGSLILLRVAGDFEQGATLLEFDTKNKQMFFTALPVGFYYRFQNTGDDHLRPVGDVFITNTIGRTTKILRANPIDGSVLPQSIRRFETVWTKATGPKQQEPVVEVPKDEVHGFWNNVKYQWQNFAFGKYKATIKVVYGTKELRSANAKVTFWVIPWQLLLVTISGAAVILVVGRFSLKRYNRYIIAQSQRQGNASPRKKVRK
jgi:hypothetical protein